MNRLQEMVRQAVLAAQSTYGEDQFDAMSWLDLELEDNPQSFDACFEISWDLLSEEEKGERAKMIRSVL